MLFEIKNSFASNTWQLYYLQRIENAHKRQSVTENVGRLLAPLRFASLARLRPRARVGEGGSIHTSGIASPHLK